ncbi:hypothetical protein [Xanthomonas sp. NCPPB 2632]|jgi:hypothetical protein|uniref:hypothetical protein n=1 Tax=Xanthomonas sp. NCPPB 2632 TaxID=3240912 RepID=UPI00351260C8
MSLLEQRTNHALRALDDDLRAGRTSVEDYRAYRRHLFHRLRAGLETTRDVTVRRPTPCVVPAGVVTGPREGTDGASASAGTHVRAGPIVVWTLLLILLAGCVVILLPIVRGP